jgi:hypothetical protein
MLVSAISGNNLGKASFRALSDENLQEQPQYREMPKKAGKLVSVPVVVLMTLSPSLLNAQGSEQRNGEFGDYPQTELLAMATPAPQTQSSGGVEARIARVRGGVNVPADVRKEVVQHKERFTVNGKGYTMYWVDGMKESHKTKDPNLISDIYFVPDGYKPVIIGEEHDKNQPPQLKGLIMHDYGTDEECFCGAIVREIVYDKNTNRSSAYEYEMRLDNDAANHILDLLNGDTKFNYPATTVRKNMSTVTTPALQGKKQVW